MEIDLRQLAFATLWKKYEKTINNEKTKEAIRNGEATYKFADYCSMSLGKCTTARYSPEDQAKIDKFIKDNHIEKITETKENYKIEFIPSQKAKREFHRMLKELQDNEHKNLAKVASKVQKTMK